MREDIGRFKKIIFKYFELAASLREGTYIACSLSEFDAIRKMLPSARVALCENAVDFEDFQNIAPVSRKFPTDFVKVVSVGGIRPQKGPLEFAKIAARFDKKNIRFVWVGDGGRELRDVLIGAGVTVTGWMSREETIEELHASDVYLSTARWEGMPVSVIEACAANTPVILRNSAGNVDIVKDGESGFLFSNTEQCIELLNEYLEQPARFRSVARVAYKQVFERFSVDRFVQKLSEIYNV